MRLGQLARKLKVEPSTIVKFLAKNNIIIENAPNVKIEDDNLALTLTQFEVKEATPVIREEEQIIKTVAEIIVENTVTEKAEEPSIDDIQTNLIEETIEASSLEEHPIIVEKNIDEDDNSLTEEETPTINEIDGVIRAPKVKLEGIKVVGKIELPEPTKKEIEKKEKEITTDVVVDQLQNEESSSSDNKLHPNKQSRLKTTKPTIVRDKKVDIKEEKPLTKQEAKALRKAKQAKDKKKKKKLASKQQLQNEQLIKSKKKKKKATPPPPKRGFWARLFGFGK